MIRAIGLACVASLTALLTILAPGCAPPGAVNEQAVLDSTPHSEPAPYATSNDAYYAHKVERATQGNRKLYDNAKSIPKGGKKGRKR